MRGALNIFIYLCLGICLLALLTLVFETNSTVLFGVVFGFLIYIIVLARSIRVQQSGLAYLIRNMMVSALALAVVMLVLSSFFVFGWRFSSTDAIGLDRHDIVHVWDLDLVNRSGPGRLRAELKFSGWPTWISISNFFRLQSAGFGVRHFRLPIVIILALLAVPTGLVWWLDRRKLDDRFCSKCKYDLTGNVSGICPECGEAIGSTSKPG